MELKGRTEIYSLSSKGNTTGLEHANSGYRRSADYCRI